MKGLTDIAGIRVGHVTDAAALTGCTVVLCEGAVGGVDVRGSASGTAELGVLDPLHVTSQIHAICLAGGSAFGLEASAGVRRYLAQKKVGFPTPGGPVPIVPSAILYDLSIGKPDHPTREMGYKAAAEATAGPVAEGNVGAGTGATAGKAFGIANAMKGGLGSATIALEGAYLGVLVSALVAVNPLGDVLDERGNILAGARQSATSKVFADSANAFRKGIGRQFFGQNTTLAVVATNAALPKVDCQKLAQLASLGMARTINPVNTQADGDITFALSLGSMKADVTSLGVAAADAVAMAIRRAVRAAQTAGGVPGLAGESVRHAPGG